MALNPSGRPGSVPAEEVFGATASGECPHPGVSRERRCSSSVPTRARPSGCSRPRASLLGPFPPVFPADAYRRLPSPPARPFPLGILLPCIIGFS